jgi:hypothetical protein
LLEPFVPGPVRGVRFWTIDVSPEAAPLLRSPRGDSWRPAGEPTRARCSCGCQTAPSAACCCGLYAFHPWSKAFDPGAVSGRQVGSGVWTVWGEVEAWGGLEVHEDGFRAEFARPAAVYIPSLLTRDVRVRIQEVAQSHGVPSIGERSPLGFRRRPDRSRAISRGFVRDLLCEPPESLLPAG